MKNRWKEKLRNKKFLCKIIPAVILFPALLLAALYTVIIKPNLSDETYIYKEKTVQKGDLTLGIIESGNILIEESSVNYTLNLESGEESDDDNDEEEDDDEDTVKYLEIEEVYAVSGQRIKEGDALFKMTDKSRNAVEKRFTSFQTDAEIALSEAETEYKIQLLTAKSTYDTSILEANKADSSYHSSKTRTQESADSLTADIKVLEAEIAYYSKQLEDEDLWESLEDARADYTSAKDIYEDTDVHNGAAYASNYVDYQSAKEQLETIQGSIDELNENIKNNKKSIQLKQQQLAEASSTIEIEKLTDESSYRNAVQGGELAEEIYSYTLSVLQEGVAAAETDLEEAENNLEELKSFVGEDGIIYANGSGIVTNVAYEAGDKLIDAGAVLSYAKDDSYTVSIDASEEDVSAIVVGDKVDVVLNAYPDTKYEGTVISITTTAASEYAATISYPVNIKIEGNTTMLYGGMTAEVSVVTDSVKDVLYISKKAVQTIDGKTYVYKKGTEGGMELAQVETGFSNSSSIEIISGLSEGDTVYIQGKITATEVNRER